MINEPIKFPGRCKGCGGPLSHAVAYLNEEIKEGHKKRYRLAGLLCGACADKSRAQEAERRRR